MAKKTVFFGFQMKNPKTPIRMGDEAKPGRNSPRNHVKYALNWAKTAIFSENTPILHVILGPFWTRR